MNGGRIYSIWLASGIGSAPGAYHSLIKEFGTPEGVYRSDLPGERPELSPSVLRALREKDLSAARFVLDYCTTHRIRVLTPEDRDYPATLRELPDLPAALYVRGQLPDLSAVPAVALVGTRTMSGYGLLRAYDLGFGCGAGGAVVVSGMAAGSDAAALAGCIDAGGVPVAVLGCGVDRAYPRRHAYLMEEIVRRGAVLSEYVPGSEILPSHFPERNRIISGLSRAVCVVEAPQKSGAMITASLAEKQGKLLFSVPGPVGIAGSEGTNDLLRRGAQPALEADDILRGFLFLYPDRIRVSAARPRGAEEAERALTVHRLDPGALLGKEKRRESSPPLAEDPSGESRTKSEKKKKTPFRFPLLPKKEEKEPEASAPDGREEILSRLDAKTAALYRTLPEGKAFLPDEAVSGEYRIGEIMCALTVLEVNGLVRALPGGRFLLS